MSNPRRKYAVPKGATSVRFPDTVRKDAEKTRVERGFQSLSAFVVQSVRNEIRGAEMAGMERRIAASHERLIARIETVREEYRASFALMLALARELLTAGMTPAQVQQRLLNIVNSARADFSGLAKQFFIEDDIPAYAGTEEQDLPFPDDEFPPSDYNE